MKTERMNKNTKKMVTKRIKMKKKKKPMRRIQRYEGAPLEILRPAKKR